MASEVLESSEGSGRFQIQRYLRQMVVDFLQRLQVEFFLDYEAEQIIHTKFLN